MSNTKHPFKTFSAIIGPQSLRGQEANLRLRNDSFVAKSHEMMSKNLASISLCRRSEGGSPYELFDALRPSESKPRGLGSPNYPRNATRDFKTSGHITHQKNVCRLAAVCSNFASARIRHFPP